MRSNRLDSLLTQSSKQNPEGLAVIHPSVGQVTYAALSELCSVLAETLRAAGVKPGDRVGLCAPKSIGTVASIFSSLSIDACYVPVDPGAPAERSAYIFSDCSISALLIDRPLMEGLARELQHLGVIVSSSTHIPTPDYCGVDLELLTLEYVEEKHTTPTLPRDRLAYILYTSGSTGKPKGVMHSHSTAMAFVDWCSEEFGPEPEDRFSSHAPFHFDLSIFDLYVSIKHNSTLVLIGEEEGKQPLVLAKLIADHKISIWYSTPSILRLLVEYGKLHERKLSSLRTVLYAGEVFPLKHLKALHEILPKPEYYNLYGPTETNVCTFKHLPDPIPENTSLPNQIGTICSGNIARVVGHNGLDVQPGDEGELWIAGDSVHLGYWNLPEHNENAFSIDDSENRWYKTGDLVIDQGEEGFLFLGRRDRMVKRRGYRVELGEIENALYTHEYITEAAVVAVPDDDSGVQLRAFIQWTGDSRPSIIAMKRFTSEKLLSYMIPDSFVFLELLPKTSTDKIDYQKLKEL